MSTPTSSGSSTPRAASRGFRLALALLVPYVVVGCHSNSPPPAPCGPLDSGLPNGAGGRGRDGGEGGKGGESSDADGREASASDADRATDAGDATSPESTCGNGRLDPGEECDDGNLVDGDGCTRLCTDNHLCEACLKNSTEPDNSLCPEAAFPPCAGLQGYAPAGPAAGEKRSELCLAVYDCVFEEKCATTGIGDCYCGSAKGLSCASQGAADGKCKDAIEAGMESSDPSTIIQHLGNVQLPAGVAVSLFSCAEDNCQRECFPYRSVPDGSVEVPGAGGATGSGGAPGTGGTPGTGGARTDAGAPDETAVKAVLNTKSPSCLACAETNCADPGIADVAGVEGNATAGPAQGASRKQLALDTLTCAFQEGCADATSCYCGTANPIACTGGAANGKCKSVIEKGLETTDPSIIYKLFSDTSLGSGVAFNLLSCVSDALQLGGDDSCAACFQ